MTRKTRSHLPAGAGGNGGGGTEIPQQVMTLEDFGRHLYRMIKKRDWTQSEFARRAGLTRASISDYINGRAEPTQTSVQKMARAFGVNEHEVTPNHLAKAIKDDSVDFEWKVSPGNPSLVRLRMDRLVSFETASKIGVLLAEDSKTFEHVVNGG